jgi:hypothetical protein
MNIHLVVVQAFGPYGKGDHITDPTQIATILASAHAGHVVRVATAQEG